METYFLNLLILLCGSMPEQEKALCIYDMAVCREEINHNYGYETEALAYDHCLVDKYLGYFNWPQAQETKE